jgi:hypothetical protein
MELANKDLFLEHRIESAANNVIVCQVDMNSFQMALKSVLGSYYSSTFAKNNSSVLQSVLMGKQIVTLKLAKRNQLPCLCLDGTGGDQVEIHQAIPVRILKQSEMQYHLPPQINVPQVQLELPKDRPLKTVVDKFKSFGHNPFLYLNGSMKGDLTIRFEHDGASLACFYSNLKPVWSDEEEDVDVDRSNDRSCILKVDASKLSTCLQWQISSSLQVSSCLMGMVHNEMLVLHICIDETGFFTYYIPVYFLHEDDLV